MACTCPTSVVQRQVLPARTNAGFALFLSAVKIGTPNNSKNAGDLAKPNAKRTVRELGTWQRVLDRNFSLCVFFVDLFCETVIAFSALELALCVFRGYFVCPVCFGFFLWCGRFDAVRLGFLAVLVCWCSDASFKNGVNASWPDFHARVPSPVPCHNIIRCCGLGTLAHWHFPFCAARGACSSIEFYHNGVRDLVGSFAVGHVQR